VTTEILFEVTKSAPIMAGSNDYPAFESTMQYYNSPMCQIMAEEAMSFTTSSSLGQPKPMSLGKTIRSCTARIPEHLRIGSYNPFPIYRNEVSARYSDELFIPNRIVRITMDDGVNHPKLETSSGDISVTSQETYPQERLSNRYGLIGKKLIPDASYRPYRLSTCSVEPVSTNKSYRPFRISFSFQQRPVTKRPPPSNETIIRSTQREEKHRERQGDKGIAGNTAKNVEAISKAASMPLEDSKLDPKTSQHSAAAVPSTAEYFASQKSCHPSPLPPQYLEVHSDQIPVGSEIHHPRSKGFEASQVQASQQKFVSSNQHVPPMSRSEFEAFMKRN
jgi:hypothetical protein